MTARTVAVALLILLSSAASLYYALNGVVHPEAASVYNRAEVSRIGIQLLSVLLGAGSVLIWLPQTFRLGGAFLIAHSMLTIGCFLATRGYKGALLETAFLQLPIFLVCVGYPSAVLDRAKSLFS